MRNMIFFAVKDLAVQAFMAPSPQMSTEAAIRSFKDQVNDGQSVLSKHPEDYELYRLSPWDEETGIFLPVDEGVSYLPVLVVRGVDVLKQS